MSSSMHSRGYFPTSERHQLYWERHGTPGAEPVFFLHGGPGGRSSLHHLEFFDLRCFDVVMFDQRGCGRSLPVGELRDNNAGLCVEDTDALREYFGFEKISLLGVSWGSWLAIQYQQRYPHAVLKTTLVSLFVPFPANVSAYDRALDAGLSEVNPGAAHNRAKDLYRILTDGCPTQQRHAAIEWLKAIMRRCGQTIQNSTIEDFADEHAVRAIRLELHYHLNAYFFTAKDEDLSLNDNTLIIQGIRDVHGMASVRWLRQRMNIHCRLLHAGHNAFETAILKTVCRALKREIER